MDTEYKKCIDELARAIVKNIQENTESDGDPVEEYTNRLRGHVYSDTEQFRSRFVHGYEALLNEIVREEAIKSGEDKPIPPGAVVL